VEPPAGSDELIGIGGFVAQPKEEGKMTRQVEINGRQVKLSPRALARAQIHGSGHRGTDRAEFDKEEYTEDNAA